MSALVVAGAAVLLLGAVVLLRFPDRPGGRIAWQGLEVSSIGAGLPLVVVGLVAVTLGSGIGRNDGEDAERASTGSPGGGDGARAAACARALEGVDPGRVATVEVGTRDQVVVRSDEPKVEPFGLALVEGGAAIATVRAAYVSANDLFRLEAVVDAGCDPVTVTNLTSPGTDPGRPANFSDLRLAVGPPDIVLGLKGGSDVRVDLSRYAP